MPFTVECDASNHTLAASLNQGGRPIAFHSRTLSPSERRYSAVEKEAAAIIDAVRKWNHFLFSKRFQLITDQRAVSFLFNPQRLGKIKNTKIQLWRTELGNFDYNIVHRPGKQNIVPDTLSRVCSVMYNGLNLVEIHKVLGHPGVATSRSTPYHPTGNAQCERVNQTVWRTVKLTLRNLNLPELSWETVLPQSLHSVRSLLCTTTNATPHERFLNFHRRSMLGRSLPNWLLQPGPVLLRRFVRTKNQPLVDVVELVEANPNFAIVKFSDGRESTVSVADLAPSPTREVEANEINPYPTSEAETSEVNPSVSSPTHETEANEIDPYAVGRPQSTPNALLNESQSSELREEKSQQALPSNSRDENRSDLRRSTRTRKPPDRFGVYITH